MNGISFNKSAILGDMDELTEVLSNHISNTNNPHQVTADQIDAVKKSGDTMTGTLTVATTSPAKINVTNTTTGRTAVIQSDGDGKAQLWNSQDAENAQYLSIDSEANDISQAVILSRREGTSTPTVYKIFGEHNVDTAKTVLNYVSRSGDTMTGDLTISRPSVATVTTNVTNTGRKASLTCESETAIRVENQTDFLHKSWIGLDSYDSTLSDIIKLYIQDNINSRITYRLFGEHNVDLAKSQLNCVSKSGDTMTGGLSIQTASYPEVEAVNTTTNHRAELISNDAGNTDLTCKTDSNNLTWLCLEPSSGVQSQTISLYRTIAGTQHRYQLFGEHNPDILATTIRSLFTGGDLSVVKSVQRGVKTSGSAGEDQTTTITAVNLNKSHACLLGVTGSDGAYAYVTLTNSTTLTVHFGASGTSQTVSWEVIEFY